MSKSAIQPDSGSGQGMEEHLEAGEGGLNGTTALIWTPRFLLLFALTLVLGVSLESLLASGWSTGVVTGDGYLFLLGHIVLTVSGWLALGIVTRSRWIRIGCMFGCLCALFLTVNVFTVLFGVDANSPVQSYINVATCTALLGAYIGLSIDHPLLSSWEIWLFLALPLLGCVGVTLTYLLTPQASIITSENALATATLIAACLVWWARPSCWKRCPGPTFLFGLVPFIQLCMAPVNNSIHTFFFLQVLAPRVNTYMNLNNFFFAQFILLSLFLGCLRTLKSEMCN